MGAFFDSVPFSGIIRIRDMMYGVKDPFRLDQGDVSFDAPETVKAAMIRAVAENRSHYLPTTGLPHLRELVAAKLREKNGVPVTSPEEVFVTQGGIHALYIALQALLEPGDEVLIPDPIWPPALSNVLMAQGVPVRCALDPFNGWRWDLDRLRHAVSKKTKAIYLNTPHNPTGGVLTRRDLETIAEIARAQGVWIIADESYEDIVYGDAGHVSIASIEDLYERTLCVYTFSKTYAMTGLRLGYLAVGDPALRERVRKLLFFTVTNASSVVQYGGIGALEGPQTCVEQFRRELSARRDLFYGGIEAASGGVLSGEPPAGAFYAFLRIDPFWTPRLERHTGVPASRSWALVEELIKVGRIGCVPGVDFGPAGEEHVRFCFAREREELSGALAAMRQVFA
jgi:aspartate aminotransferase